MKKIYLSVITIIGILLISSSYASAGLSLISNSSESTSSIGLDSSLVNPDSSELNNEGPQFNDDVPNLDSEFSVDNVPKVKILSIDPNPTYVKTVTTFKGSIINLENSSISYKWDFGDGEFFQDSRSDLSVGCEITHIYSAPGTYTVTLYLLKENIEIDSDSAQVTVLDILSDGKAGGPYLGFVGDKIWFTESKISLYGIRQSLNFYDWDFGDGTTGRGEKVYHQYSKVGKYPVKLKITDELGNINTDTTTVTIAKTTISIRPSRPIVSDEVNFGVEVLGFIPTSYSWDFGDGYFGEKQSPLHIYKEAGTYYGRLRLVEDSNEIFTNFVVRVGDKMDIDDNQKPLARFVVSSITSVTSTLFEFDASLSIDLDGEISFYEWYFGDGNMIITSNPKCSHIFKEKGEYNVKCIVIDNNGGVDSKIKEIMVNSDSKPSSDFSLNNRDGMIFSSGEVKTAEVNPQPDANEEEDKIECDLKIFVSDKSDLSESIDSKTMHVTIIDSSGKYDANIVNVKLSSNLPGYESVEYIALKNHGSGEFSLEIEIPHIPEDIKSCTMSITASPDSRYSEADWSENRWSETILSEEEPEPTELTSDPALDIIIYGNFAL